VQIFTFEFWATALEHALVAGAATFYATQVYTTSPTWHTLAMAGIAAGVAALYAFVKQIGGVEVVNGVLKVGIKARHTTGSNKS
jgi:hypothetical protein